MLTVSGRRSRSIKHRVQPRSGTRSGVRTIKRVFLFAGRTRFCSCARKCNEVFCKLIGNYTNLALIPGCASLMICLRQVQSSKPQMQRSKRGFASFPESCRLVRAQQRRPCRMDCGGRTRRREAVKSDGLFPRYQGKTCDGTSPSGRTCANLGGTAEVFRLLSQRSIPYWSFRGQGSFFLARKGPGRKELTPWQTKTFPTRSTCPRTKCRARGIMSAPT